MDIQDMVEKGLALVRDDQTHDLRVGFRCNLLSLFDDEPASVGRTWRTKLAALAVEKVLPIWKASYPDDRTPQAALSLVQMILVNEASSTYAESELDRLWLHCDELSWNDVDKQASIMVGYGAIQAAREALSARHFGCETVHEDSTDRDVGPYDHDSSFCAAIAYSGGPPWDKNSNAQKRFEFWVWWLTSALPAAMKPE